MDEKQCECLRCFRERKKKEKEKCHCCSRSEDDDEEVLIYRDAAQQADLKQKETSGYILYHGSGGSERVMYTGTR